MLSQFLQQIKVRGWLTAEEVGAACLSLDEYNA